jgi:hypothetical protein
MAVRKKYSAVKKILIIKGIPSRCSDCSIVAYEEHLINTEILLHTTLPARILSWNERYSFIREFSRLTANTFQFTNKFSIYYS